MCSILVLFQKVQAGQTLTFAFAKFSSKAYFPSILIGLPLLCYETKKLTKIAITVLVAFAVMLALWFLPFYLLGWIVPSQFNAYFKMAGGLTLFNGFELFTAKAALPVGLEFLGYLWIPALLIIDDFVYRHPPKSMVEIVQAAVALLLIFFLTLHMAVRTQP